MNRTDALKEAITEETYGKEPLALAIISYLSQADPSAQQKISSFFDQHMSNRLEQKIKEFSESTDA